MPREIKTTLAVDGEQAFTRAINQASNSMRNMGSQLTLATAQFKKDGDAMKLVETRSKALNGQITQQEEIVKALEKAVEDSTKAYGANSEKTEKWESELNRARAKLVNLQSELTLNDAGLDRNGKAFEESAGKAADYQATLATIGKNVSFKTVTEGIGKINDTVEGAIKKVFNLAKTIRETFAEAGNWADDLMTDATKYDMDVEELQRWRNAAYFIDTDVDTIIGARDKLSKKIKGGWKDGDMDMWKVLGIDLKDAETGKARDKMDVMWEVGETLLNIAEMQERGATDMDAEALSMEVFGKSWRDLLPLFKAGREEWEKTVASQKVVSKERVENLTSLDDANQRLANSWETLKYSFLAEIAPTVTEITDVLTRLLDEFNDWMSTEEGKKAMEDLSAAIQELFSGLKDVKFEDAIKKAQQAISGIQSVFIWLNDNKDTVVSTLKAIGGGLVALKVSNTVLQLLQLRNGFNGLLGGGNGGNGGGNGGGSGAPVVTGGGNGGTGGVTGGGAATAGGGAAAKTGILSKVADFAIPVAVVAAAVTPAVLAQQSDEQRWIEKYESTEAVANAVETIGKDASLLRKLNAASGPKSDGNGGYKRGALGFLDMNPTDQADLILQMLGEEKNRGLLYSDIMRYGPTNGAGDRATSSGWYAWDELLRYWGLKGDNETLDPQRISSLIEYLREMETKKQESALNGTDVGALMTDAVADMKISTESMQKTSDLVTSADVKKFNSIPANIETSAERGVRRGISGLNINIDGQRAGKILAPYISQEQGQDAQ